MLPFFLPRQCVQLSSFFRKGFASLGFAVLSVGGWLHSLFHNSPSVLRGKCPCSFSSCFGSVPSGLAASGSNPNYPCSPEVEILLHNQPRELRVLQLRAHLGCLLEVSLERDGRMRREMGAVGNGCGTGSDTGGCRGHWHEEFPGGRRSRKSCLQKTSCRGVLDLAECVEPPGSSKQAWSCHFCSPCSRKISGTFPTSFQRQKDVGCQGDVEEHQCAGSHLGAGVTGVRPQDGTLVFHHFMQGAFLIEFQL